RPGQGAGPRAEPLGAEARGRLRRLRRRRGDRRAARRRASLPRPRVLVAPTVRARAGRARDRVRLDVGTCTPRGTARLHGVRNRARAVTRAAGQHLSRNVPARDLQRTLAAPHADDVRPKAAALLLLLALGVSRVVYEHVWLHGGAVPLHYENASLAGFEAARPLSK